MNLKIKMLDKELPAPHYAHPGDAGLDICSSEDATIYPGERISLGTGLAVEIPEGHVGLAFPKSGRGINEGLSIVNAVGVIDSGYRGELKASLINHDRRTPIYITRGQKVFQLVVVPCAVCELELVEELSSTSRGEGGFGSTGL